MIKKIYKEQEIIPAHFVEKEQLVCDKCGAEIYTEFDDFSSIRVYDDTDVYKERKYKYYLGYDLCENCVEEFLLPLLEHKLHKEPNKYEKVYEFNE